MKREWKRLNKEKKKEGNSGVSKCTKMMMNAIEICKTIDRQSRK